MPASRRTPAGAAPAGSTPPARLARGLGMPPTTKTSDTAVGLVQAGRVKASARATAGPATAPRPPRSTEPAASPEALARNSRRVREKRKARSLARRSRFDLYDARRMRPPRGGNTGGYPVGMALS